MKTQVDQRVGRMGLYGLVGLAIMLWAPGLSAADGKAEKSFTIAVTDQQGVERYTTEVVLQNFRGELTLLDRAGGGGGGEGFDQGGGDFGAAGPTAGRDRQPAMSGSRRNELDDDIPF